MENNLNKKRNENLNGSKVEPIKKNKLKIVCKIIFV